jgi:hypothetical protein
MLNNLLKSDNDFVRYGTAVAVVFGGIYLAISVGIVPEKIGWFFAVLVFVSFILKSRIRPL